MAISGVRIAVPLIGRALGMVDVPVPVNVSVYLGGLERTVRRVMYCSMVVRSV